MKSNNTKLLVTGFGPFEEFDRNPSHDIAQAANGQLLHGINVHGLSVPVSWKQAWPLIKKATLRYKPSGLLMLGLAPDHWFRFERVAINRNRGFVDVENNYPPSVEIVRNGVETIESTLPLVWLRHQIQCSLGHLALEVRYSEDAGGYLCNNVYYMAMNKLEGIVPWRGFIHVPAFHSGDSTAGPYLSEQAILEVGCFIVERLAFWIAQKPQASFSNTQIELS